MTQPIRHFLLRIGFVLFFYIFYGLAVLCYSTNAYQHKIIIGGLCFVLILILIAWQYFMPKFRDEAYELHDMLWAFVLTMGSLGVLIAYIAEVSVDHETGKKWEEVFGGFFSKKAGELSAVFLVSILTDFIVTAFIRLQSVHNQFNEISSKTNMSIENAAKVSSKLESDIPNKINSAIQAFERQADLLMWASARKESETNLFTKLQDIFKAEQATVKTQIGELIASIVMDRDKTCAINTLRDRTAKILLPYASQPDYIPALIATNCIRYMPIDNSLSTASLHLKSLSSRGEGQMPPGENFLIANYGAMSQIVDKLYAAAEDIHQAYKVGGENTKIVYLTTLPMLLTNYLTPLMWTGGGLPSVVAQWDLTRDRTRRSIHHIENGIIGKGHMWSFFLRPESLEFRRVCLYIEDHVRMRNDNNGNRRKESIYKAKNWGESCNSPAKVIKVYDAAKKAIERWRKFGNRVEDIDKYRFEAHPEFVDELSIDNLTQIDEWKAPELDKFENPNASSSLSAGALFEMLYHPNSDSAKKMGLSSRIVKALYENDKDNFSGYFNDNAWKILSKKLKEGSTDLDQKELELDTPQFWYDIFFNRHIPLDLFAIGIMRGKNEKVDWCGCIGAYIGGDPNEMLLAWHDDIIEKYNISKYTSYGTPWKAIKSFLDILYDCKDPLYESNGCERKNVIDPPIEDIDEKTETDFTRQYNTKFPFGIGPSIAGEQVVGHFNDRRAKRGPVLEIGGAYGRDAFYIVDSLLNSRDDKKIIEAYVLDTDDRWIERYNWMSEYYTDATSNVTFLHGNFLSNNWQQLSGTNHFDASKRYGVIYSYHFLHLLNDSQLKIALQRSLELLDDNGMMVHVFPSESDPCTYPSKHLDMAQAENSDPPFGHSFEKISKIFTQLLGASEPLQMKSNPCLECKYVIGLHLDPNSITFSRSSVTATSQKEETKLPIMHRHTMWMLTYKKG